MEASKGRRGHWKYFDNCDRKKVCGQPDSVAFCGGVACKCASVVAVLEEEVRSVHEQVIQSGCKSGILWGGVA